MKKIIFLLPFLFLILTAFTSGDSQPYEYRPVFMAREDLEKSVKYLPEGRELKNPGKIYYKHPYIFVNERYKGIHVINNSNPVTPVNEGYITAPGCIDMAVKDNTLYIDNATDLVAFDLINKTVTKRIINIFPEPIAPKYAYYYDYKRPENFIIVEWKKKFLNDK